LVVAGDAVGFEDATGAAAVDEGPFAVTFDPDADGFHGAAANGGAVAGGVIDMEGPEAPAAMVAVGGAVGVGVIGTFAVFADEAIGRMAMMV
jgi:hypothetical protein